MIAVLTLSLPLTGCEIRRPEGLLFCDLASPIYISREDTLTQESKRQILAHDIIGERVCGWGQRNHTS